MSRTIFVLALFICLVGSLEAAPTKNSRQKRFLGLISDTVGNVGRRAWQTTRALSRTPGILTKEVKGFRKEGRDFLGSLVLASAGGRGK